MNPKPPQDLRQRTKTYALRIIRLYSSLPKATETQIIGKQMFRSGTSAGAQYREADRGKSTPDFITKMEGGLQELDETASGWSFLSKADLCAKKKSRTCKRRPMN